MAVDLTKLSDNDLQALQANDLSKVSDDGLYELSGNAHPGLRQALKATGDVVASGLSHAIVAPAVEGIAGTAARLFNRDPAQAKANADRLFVYNAQTPQGQHLTGQLSQAVAPVAHAVGDTVNSGRDFVGKYGGPEALRILDQVGGTASDLVGVVPILGAGAKGLQLASDAARPVEAAAEVARTPDQLAQAANIRVPPSVMAATTGAEKPGLVSRTVERVADPSLVRRGDIIHNKASYNSLAKTAAGISDDKVLSRATLDEADKPHAAVYDQVREAIPDPIALSPEDSQTLVADIQAAGKDPNSARPLRASAQKEIEDALNLPQMNGRKLLGTISDYRSKGWKALLSDDPDHQALGATQLDIANALEKQMSKVVDTQAPGLSDAYRQARIGFAKNNTIREAMVGHDIDPQKVLRLANKNEGITGELKVIADNAELFPSVSTVKVPKISGHNVLAHGATYGAAGALGYATGGIPGALIGAGGAALGSAGLRGALNFSRAGAMNPQAALSTALADYAARGAVGFHPSQAVPEPAPGLLTHSPQVENSALNPQDRGLAEAIAKRHPGSARPSAPSRRALPAPGELAPRNAVAQDASTMTDSEARALMQRESGQHNLAITMASGAATPKGTGYPLHKVLSGDLAMVPGNKAVASALANRRSRGLEFADKLEGKQGMFPPLNKAGRKELRNRSER